MPDFDLLDRTYAHIAANPDEWNQTMWARRTACGTAYCFAGTAVLLARPDARFDLSDTPLLEGSDESEDAYTVLLPGEADERLISDLARELLGLDEQEASRLFDPFNDLDDLADDIASLKLAHQAAP